jgi:hypothetical protein
LSEEVAIERTGRKLRMIEDLADLRESGCREENEGDDDEK